MSTTLLSTRPVYEDGRIKFPRLIPTVIGLMLVILAGWASSSLPF